MKYIDADKLKEMMLPSYEETKMEKSHITTDVVKWEKVEYIFDFIFHLIDSLQRDETQVDKMLCSKIWWEEQGWIMIPPDATIEGIDSLLNQVRKKLQQEPTPDTDVLHTKLVNLLKTYRIGEETARTMADRIADTYGAQRYIDGLCDGLNKEDTKEEQSDEQPEYGYITTEYVPGKKPRWKVGSILAYYINTSNEEGENVLGKVVNIERDEDGEWLYTFEDEDVWDEEDLITEGTYAK